MTNKPTSELDLRFAFGGNAGQVMENHFLADAAGAILSKRFRLYYLMRPFIPISLRQTMQKTRGEGMGDLSEDWYVPTQFAKEFESAIQADVEQHSDSQIIHPWPDAYETCVSLTHDVETSEGVALVDRLAQIEESHGRRSCWYFIPYKYTIDPGLIKDLKQRGHEVGVHGYNHDGRLFSSKRIFEKRKDPMLKAFSDFQADGFRAPMVHRNLDWIKTLGSRYDASCFDIDPYQAMPGGVGSFWPFMKGDMVELPYSMPQDHTLFVALGKNDIEIWKRKLEFLKRWRAMALLITHPDYLNTGSRLGYYQELLEHLQTLENAWFALPNEIADWWRKRDQSVVAKNQSGDPEIQGPASKRGRCLALRDLCNVAE